MADLVFRRAPEPVGRLAGFESFRSSIWAEIRSPASCPATTSPRRRTSLPSACPSLERSGSSCSSTGADPVLGQGQEDRPGPASGAIERGSEGGFSRDRVGAGGYYEWLREGKLKQPLLYEVDGGKPFALAGVWEWWRPQGSDGREIESCSLITTDANELQAEIHDRMPVILDDADYDAWLDSAQQDRETLERLLVPFPAERMTARPVSQLVNNSRHEGPECIRGPEAP